MDIKTRLENEDLFDSQDAICKNRIISLNEWGIFTIEDFINCDIASITKTSYLKKYYIAIQHALRYKYKGEPLALDVLLDKEFEIRRSVYSAISSHVKIRIARNLGFESTRAGHIAKEIAKKKAIDNDDYYQHSAVKNGGFKQDSYSVSIMEILKAIAQSGDKLAQFYVDYQEKIELDERQEQTSSEILEKLKSEIVLLTTQREELDEKIRQLTEQVQILEGGDIVNGRK